MNKKFLILSVAAAAFATTSVGLAQGAGNTSGAANANSAANNTTTGAGMSADRSTMNNDTDTGITSGAGTADTGTTGAASDYRAAGERG